MKISLHWLQDFVHFTSDDVHHLAERLTVSVAEVERIERLGELLDRCCVGKITGIKKHPKADRLWLCDVETDHGKKRVVCGGSNLQKGMLVAFAHVGARVRWHGKDLMTLEKAKIRGEESEGMICSAEELGLECLFISSPSDGPSPIIDLIKLKEKIKVGQPLREALGLTDVIFHIDNHAITHRPDLFSHIGFARECVAIGIAKWKKRPKDKPIAFPKTSLPFAIHNDCRTLVPRYNACLLSIDATGTTPDWMRQRLEATGWRSVSLPVDITNYVTMELGMPLHSFDAQDLHGDIHMRETSEGEKVTNLDGIERPLPPGAVVLSDEKGIFDLLGIMGGKRSTMKDTTRTVFLHAAVVNPSVIRQTILATGLRTDAATIYEKGIPHISVPAGFSRALSLFLSLVPGARTTSQLLSFGNDGTARHIPLSLEHSFRTIGIDIPKKNTVSILENLGCSVKSSSRRPASAEATTGKQGYGRQEKLKAQSSKLVVTPPLYREDLQEEHDLIEELARVHGYDRLPARMPSTPCRAPCRAPRLRQIRIQAKEEGFLEILPLSLLGPLLLHRSGLSETPCVQVENTLGEELSLLQPSALPRLLEHAEKSFRLTGASLRTFTVTHVFTPPHEEHQTLTLLLTQKNVPSLRSSPVLLLKSHLTTILQGARFSPVFSPHSSPPPLAHPAQCASLLCHDQPIGELFTLHPAKCSAFGLPPSTAAASVNLDTLFALSPDARVLRSLPMYPSVSYDVTLSRRHSSPPLQHVLEKARRVSPLLTDLHVADLFDGKPLPAGEYNVTLRCIYQDPTRTLTEEEAKREHEKVTHALCSG